MIIAENGEVNRNSFPCTNSNASPHHLLTELAFQDYTRECGIDVDHISS